VLGRVTSLGYSTTDFSLPGGKNAGGDDNHKLSMRHV
jgi:hypothetical protein